MLVTLGTASAGAARAYAALAIHGVARQMDEESALALSLDEKALQRKVGPGSHRGWRRVAPRRTAADRGRQRLESSRLSIFGGEMVFFGTDRSAPKKTWPSVVSGLAPPPTGEKNGCGGRRRLGRRLPLARTIPSGTRRRLESGPRSGDERRSQNVQKGGVPLQGHLVASSSHAAQATERVDRDFLTPVGAAQYR